MYFLRNIILCSLCLLPWVHAKSQLILSEEEAVNRALKNNPFSKSASLLVSQQKQLEGSSFNLANPDFTLESPTGEFMTVGVLQSFEFPTVYVKQGQLAKQNTALAEKGKVLTDAEVIQQVKMAYLNLQYYQALLKELKKKDSLYSAIAEASTRKFNAGQVDFVEKTFALSQYGETHNQYQQVLMDANSAMRQLQIYTGTQEMITGTVLKRNQLPVAGMDSLSNQGSLEHTPLMQYHVQLQNISKASLQLEKNKILPGFSLGFMNQGTSNTPTPLRIRAGINLPIWFWQYSASIKAAKTNTEMTRQNALAQQQNLSLRLQQLQGDISKFSASLDYYESGGLDQAESLVNASLRLFEAGESDSVTHLRTLSDALDIRLNYLEAVKDYNLSLIQFNSLTGK